MKTKTFILTVLISLFCGNLFSQEEGTIIYTDFEPDSIIFPVNYCSSGCNPIDVNYDLESDFYFCKKFYSPGYFSLEMYVYSTWEICKISHDEISTHTNWSSHINIETGSHMSNNNVIIKYGLRYLKENGEYCYGWLRLSYVVCGTGYEVKLYDMAYCTIPNYPLKFGQKSLTDDVAEIDDANCQYELYPNPVDDRLVLKFADDHKCENVTVCSIDGRMLISQNTDFENIDVSALTRGVYFVRIRLQEGSVFTEKIVIK